MDISQLKNIGMMQNMYMWECNIPIIPYLGISNFKFLVRTTNIPAKTRGTNTYHFMGQQYNLPAMVTHEGKWACTILLSETHDVFDTLAKWHALVDTYGNGVLINTIKAEIQLKLLSINNNTVTKRFRMIGAFPEVIPSVGELNQDTTTGSITLNYSFSIDNIDFDSENLLSF
jgi:hypothetical protein